MPKRIAALVVLVAVAIPAWAAPIAAAPGDEPLDPVTVTGEPQDLDAAADGSLYVLTDVARRYLPDGSPDRSFMPATPLGDELWHEIHALRDGAIVIASRTTPEGGATSDDVAVRLRADGSRDPAYGTNGRIVLEHDDARATAVDAAGRLVALGVSVVSRRLPTGGPDPTFGDNGRVDVSSFFDIAEFVDVLDDGRVQLTGTLASTSNSGIVLRLTSTGAVDDSYGDVGMARFDLGGTRTTYLVDVVARGDGSIVATSNTTGIPTNGMYAVSADGRDVDTGAPTVRCGTEVLDGLTAAPDGTVLARVNPDGGGSVALARIRADLTVDRTFGEYGTAVPDGRMLGPVVQAPQQRAVVLADAGDHWRLRFVELGTTTAVRRPTGAAGYWIVGDRGGVFSFGDVPFCGSAYHGDGTRFVDATASKEPYGYWLLTDSGTVESRGAARHFGNVDTRLVAPALALIGRPQGDGYWIAAADGGIFSFGNAAFHGSTGNIRLNQPIVGAAATPTGNGYWIVARDGGVFSFGDATFYGSTGGIRLNQPVVAMEPTPTGHGYWLVASDGGVFSFGDARFLGSTGAIRLARPIVGIDATSTGIGYRLVARDGGIFAFGDADYHGSIPALVNTGVPIAESAIAVVH